MSDHEQAESGLSDSVRDLLEGVSNSIDNPAFTSSWRTRHTDDDDVDDGVANSTLLSSSSASSNSATPTVHASSRGRTSAIQRSPGAGPIGSFAISSAISPPPPPRSIFASGPPISSVTANTAHASLSRTLASSSSLPLSALTGAAPGPNRRAFMRVPDLPLATSSTTIPGTEKDVDDYDGSQLHDLLDTGSGNTSHHLASLFTSDSPGVLSREPTRPKAADRTNSLRHERSSLAGHLLYNGFLGGKHSDITIQAFGQDYKLHKLILDRAPYFSTAFCGPWTESSASVIKVMPDEMDPNITQTSFELALKRLYGSALPEHEEPEAVGLFATACWLDMPDLVDICVDYILRQMSTATLPSLIRLVTTNYYSRPGDRILASAKALLMKEGYEMPCEHWDGIPAEIVREIIGGDPFYVPGEWERWFLTLKILNRRLRRMAITNNLVDVNGKYLVPRPRSLKFFAVRFDTTYRRDAGIGVQNQWSDQDDMWSSLYTSPDISPLLVLLDEGIHYVHLRFEQLQFIKGAKDVLGVPVLPQKVVSDALWMQMELRQRIINAHENDLDLGLSEFSEESESSHEVPTLSEKAKGKIPEDFVEVENESGSWDGNGQPRKFWIPSSDFSCILGGVKDAITSPAATSSGEWNPSANRISASLEPSDVAWAVDFTSSVFDNSTGPRNLTSSSPPKYSYYPPFRFCAEFPSPRTLKERKRVYSQTVWYAGSMWNIYIQRVTNSKTQQLGIYLHRAKDRDPSGDPLAQFVPSSVDDRIGQLEREMVMRKPHGRQSSWLEHNPLENEGPGEFSNSTSTLLSPSQSFAVREGPRPRPSPTTTGSDRSHRHLDYPRRSTTSENLDRGDLDLEAYEVELLNASRRSISSVSAMPPYNDARETIKTYFKIYSPSKAGRLLSMYESAPDKFTFGKSWGWKSSSLVLDDNMISESACPSLKLPEGGISNRDGTLRYMIVVGIV